MCFIVLLTLALHWFGMNLLVFMVGGEANLARGQAQASSSLPVPGYQADDGWRRTSHGWERIDRLAPFTPQLSVTHHFSLGQFWPVAWAVGMVLLICGAGDCFTLMNYPRPARNGSKSILE